MAYEHKEGSGNVFPNDKKETDKAPDFTGSFMLNGVVYRIAMWENFKESNGEEYFSHFGIKISEYEQSGGSSRPSGGRQYQKPKRR